MERNVAARDLEGLRCPSGRCRGSRQSEEIAEERLALAGQDGLRVELDTLHGEMPMAQAHDLAVLGSRGDLELGGETLLEHHQRVVARGIEVLLEIREDAERELGSQFDRLKFNDFVLAQGMLPLKLLRKAVEEQFVPSLEQKSAR